MPAQQQGKKGCAKAGRNKKACEAYRMSGQREWNQGKRLARHLHDRTGETDKSAKSAYNHCLAVLPVHKVRQLDRLLTTGKLVA